MKKNTKRSLSRVCGAPTSWPPEKARPLFRDFMGLNETHLPDRERADLYRPIARLVRDYHSASSDLGTNSKFTDSIPRGCDQRDWAQLYRTLNAAGWRIAVSVMFERLSRESWQDLAGDTRAYAERIARAFSLSGENGQVETVEIGNEPGMFSDEDFRTVTEAMGRGFKAVNPHLQVATAALTTGPSHAYYKTVESIVGLESCYDVLTIHTYAELEGWPTFERSFPEDVRLQNYLQDIHYLCAWRDAHVPDKEVWITEFGYDAVDLPPDPHGRYRHWRSATTLQQAQWTIRSWLVFATLPVARAYYFFFDDGPEAKMHHASGMTRGYRPRPVFHAAAHLQSTLGDFRFARVVLEKPGDIIILEFTHESDATRRIWVIWSPTGTGRVVKAVLPKQDGHVARAEYMPVDGEGCAVPFDAATRHVEVRESPLYVFLRSDVSAG